jgi:hypothetical protein
MGEMRNVYKILVRKPEGKRQFRRARNRWEENIKIVLKEIWCRSVDWIHLAQEVIQWQALVNLDYMSDY